MHISVCMSAHHVFQLALRCCENSKARNSLPQQTSGVNLAKAATAPPRLRRTTVSHAPTGSTGLVLGLLGGHTGQTMLSQVEPTQEGLGWAHQLACSSPQSPVLYRHCSCSPHATQSSPLTQSWVHAEPNHWYRGWCKCYTAQADLSMWAAQQHTPACPGHISCTTSPSNEMWALLSPCRPDNIKQDTNKANRKKGQKLWPASPCHPLFSCDSRHNPALNRQALLETCANWSSSFGPWPKKSSLISPVGVGLCYLDWHERISRTPGAAWSEFRCLVSCIACPAHAAAASAQPVAAKRFHSDADWLCCCHCCTQNLYQTLKYLKAKTAFHTNIIHSGRCLYQQVWRRVTAVAMWTVVIRCIVVYLRLMQPALDL